MSWAGIGETQWDDTVCERQEGASTAERICGLIAEYEKKQEQTEKLIEAGDRMADLVNEVFSAMGGPCMLQDAVKEWHKAKGEAE